MSTSSNDIVLMLDDLELTVSAIRLKELLESPEISKLLVSDNI